MRLSEVASPSAESYTNVERIEVIDDLTVKVNFKEVTPTWARPFVGIRGMILPRHMFVDYNGPNAKEAPANLTPVGTGPYWATNFELKEPIIIEGIQVQPVEILYEANPFFREAGKPYFSRIELQGGGDAEVTTRAVLEEGSADYAWWAADQGAPGRPRFKRRQRKSRSPFGKGQIMNKQLQEKNVDMYQQMLQFEDSSININAL